LAADRRRVVILAVLGEAPLGEADRRRPGLDLDVVLIQRLGKPPRTVNLSPTPGRNGNDGTSLP